MKSPTVAFAVLLTLCVAKAAAAQSCRPVNAGSQLEALLPVIPGFTQGKPTSETDPQEAVSRTTVDYEAPNGSATISVELMDSCKNPNMLAQIREYLKTGPPPLAITTSRSVPVRGFPAYEEWTAISKHAEIHILVADRFMVKVTGDFAELAKVQAAASAIDLPKLATLR